MRRNPRCPECNEFIDGELDEDGFFNGDGCPNVCSECGEHYCEACHECGHTKNDCICDTLDRDAA